jgi:surface polysaccharide O-acyltransferase-like enzyme
MHMFMMTIAIMIMVTHMPIPWKTSLMGSLSYVSLFYFIFHACIIAYLSQISNGYNFTCPGSWDCTIFPSREGG